MKKGYFRPVWAILNTMMVMVTCIALSGCKTTNPPAELAAEQTTAASLFNDDSFGDYAVPEPDELFALSESQKQAFLQYFNDPGNAHIPQHKRLYSYLEAVLSGFNFRGKTYTAEVALESGSGNCLSLAILTTALARVANLEVSYQRVNSAPVYHRFDNVMTLSSHVRTRIYEPVENPSENTIVLIKPSIIVDYFPQQGDVKGSNVSFAEFLAKYYQNMAAEWIVKEQYGQAYWHLKRAYMLQPDNAETLNSLAVLYRHSGDSAQAEKVYRYALEHTRGSANLLSNYAYLLESSGKGEAARKLLESANAIDDDNPYRWLDIANRQFARGNKLIALKYYKMAADKGPYLHESYFGLAKTYHVIGQKEKAERALERAMELSFVPEDKTLYQAKLRMLEGES